MTNGAKRMSNTDYFSFRNLTPKDSLRGQNLKNWKSWRRNLWNLVPDCFRKSLNTKQQRKDILQLMNIFLTCILKAIKSFWNSFFSHEILVYGIGAIVAVMTNKNALKRQGGLSMFFQLSERDNVRNRVCRTIWLQRLQYIRIMLAYATPLYFRWEYFIIVGLTAACTSRGAICRNAENEHFISGVQFKKYCRW